MDRKVKQEGILLLDAMKFASKRRIMHNICWFNYHRWLLSLLTLLQERLLHSFSLVKQNTYAFLSVSWPLKRFDLVLNIFLTKVTCQPSIWEANQKNVYMVVTKLQIVEVHQTLYFLTYSKDNKRKVSFLTLNSKILKQTKTLLSHLWQSQLKKGYLLPELNAS